KYKERFADADGFHFYFVGNIDENQLKKYSELYLASLPSSGTPSNYKVFDFRPLTGSHTKVVEKGEDPKSQVRLTWQGPATYSKEDNFALHALADALTIKLVEVLREEESGVYGISAKGHINKTPYPWFSFRISFPCGPENVDKLKKSALEELQKMIENGPTEKDLNKVKKADLVEHKENMKKNRYWISHLKDADFDQESPVYLTNYKELVDGLSVEKLKKLAQKYLTKGHLTAILNPETGEGE